MSWGQGGAYDSGYPQYGGYSQGGGFPSSPYQQNEGQQQQQGGFYNPNQYNQNQNQYTEQGQQEQPHGGHHGPNGQQPGGTPFNIPAPGQFLQDPLVTGMAMNYGKDFLKEGQKTVEDTVEKYVSIGQLKYYFAVDNSYVSKKLGLLLFPFLHKDWSIRYNQDEPVQPRFELNAADLYIPSMAFVTYILVVGYVLGLNNRFSPEVLAATASSAMVWLILEILVIYLTTTVGSIKTTLAKWDFLAFSAYKYVGMIVSLLVGMVLSTKGYYVALIYSILSFVLFLFRTLHLRVEPEVHGVENHGKRKLWLLFLMAGWQPLIMWWLTYSLVPQTVTIPEPPPDF